MIYDDDIDEKPVELKLLDRLRKRDWHRSARIGARLAVVSAIALMPVYGVLTHGEAIGERLQYLGGKLRNAGATVTVVVEKAEEQRSLQEEYEAELATLHKDLDICRNYLEGALRVTNRTVTLPKPPKPGKATGG